ncbi:MAG: MFS transporter [Candidatus Tumulicola sp.]
MRANTPSALRLGLFWLGIQAVWGALLGISLQARTIELVASSNALIAYGRLATIGALVAAVVQIAVGPFSDDRRRHGSRRIEFYVAGTAIGAFALAGFFAAGNFTALTLAFVALQAGLNFAIGPYQAIIPDAIPRSEFGRASSWMAALQSAGNALGAVLAATINDGRMLASSLIVLLGGTAAATCAHVRRIALEPPPQRERLRFTRGFADLFVSRALVYVGFYTLLGYLLFYVTGVLETPSLAVAKLQSGELILAFTAMGALGAAAAARPSDRFDKRLVATAGGAIVVIALGGFIAAHTFAGAAAATLLAGFGWGIFLAADWSIACRILPPGALATTMGIWNLAVILPQVIAPALTTAVLAHLALAAAGAAPKAAFALAAAETFIGVAWLWRLPSAVLGE